MKYKCLNFLILFSIVLVTSCASSFPIHLLCSEKHIELYVNDEYIGREQVTYIVPKGQETILVSCRENNVEIYSRQLYIKNRKNELIELHIPKDYRYSNSPNTFKSRTR